MCSEKSISFLLISVIMILDPSAAEEPTTLDGEAENPDPATTPRDTAEQPATVGNLGHWWHDYISKIKESTPTKGWTTKPPVQSRITKQFWWMTVEVPNDQTVESFVTQKVPFFPPTLNTRPSVVVASRITTVAHHNHHKHQLSGDDDASKDQNNSTCAPCPCQMKTTPAQSCPHCECHNSTTSGHDSDGPSKAPDGIEMPEDNDKNDNITTTEKQFKKCTCETTPNSIEQCTCAPGKVGIARTATLKSMIKGSSRKNLATVSLILSLLFVLCIMF